jgi:hypothetical protein
MAKFYTDSQGRRRPITQSLFRPPRDRVLARRISIAKPSEAHDSVSYLESRYRSADTRAERVKLVRAANSAANRAKVMSKSSRISPAEREEMARVSQIYRAFVEKHKGENSVRRRST